MSLPLASRPALKKWKPVGRYWSCARSSSRDHSSLTGDARQPRRRPLLGDGPRDPRHLDVVLAHEPPAESAAGPHEVERDVLGRDAGAERRMLLGRNLARRPDLELPVVEVGGRVLRLERRVRQQREEVLGFDGLRRGAERRVDVADHGIGGRRASRSAACRLRRRRWRRRGCGAVAALAASSRACAR